MHASLLFAPLFPVRVASFPLVAIFFVLWCCFCVASTLVLSLLFRFSYSYCLCGIPSVFFSPGSFSCPARVSAAFLMGAFWGFLIRFRRLWSFCLSLLLLLPFSPPHHLVFCPFLEFRVSPPVLLGLSHIFFLFLLFALLFPQWRFFFFTCSFAILFQNRLAPGSAFLLFLTIIFFACLALTLPAFLSCGIRVLRMPPLSWFLLAWYFLRCRP